jgi:hypothetical protein
MEALDLFIRMFAILSDIRGHIPQSDGFESFRSDSAPTGALANVATFLTTAFCIAAAVALVVLLAVRWLN